MAGSRVRDDQGILARPSVSGVVIDDERRSAAVMLRYVVTRNDGNRAVMRVRAPTWGGAVRRA
jgi:hypothetical protein